MLRYFLIILAVFMSGACAQITKNRSEIPQGLTDPEIIQDAQSLLQHGKNEEALKAFQEFSQNKRSSIYFLESRLGEAQAELALENFQGALEISREVSVIAGKEKLDMSARAFYLMAFAQEGLGDDLKALAALLDAYRLRSYLPAQVGQAEIPARLASIYGKLGREAQASKYLTEAEKGLQKVSASVPPTEAKSWMARTYFQMGSVTTSQLSGDNFSQFVDGQRWVQVYLIKAIKQNDPIWSPKALASLQQIYRDLLKVVDTEQVRQNQYQKASELLEIIEQADLYKPLSEHKVGSYEKDFNLYLAEVRKKTEKILYEGGERLGLTEAAKERNSLKRVPRKSKPVEIQQELPKEMGEDPNL